MIKVLSSLLGCLVKVSQHAMRDDFILTLTSIPMPANWSTTLIPMDINLRIPMGIHMTSMM